MKRDERRKGKRRRKGKNEKEKKKRKEKKRVDGCSLFATSALAEAALVAG